MEKGKSKKTIYIAIGIALLLLALGFYLYHFYPQIIPGMARISLEKDLHVLVIGLDDIESEENSGVFVDALVMAELNAENKEVKFTNIIQDEVKLSEEFTDDDLHLFMSEVNEVTDTELNYYFTISYKGFITLVDNLNGVDIELDDKLRVPDLDLDLEAGNNVLSGKEALNYARWYDYRKDELDRVNRQQKVIGALMGEVLKERTLIEIPELFTTIVDTFRAVKTNLSYSIITEVVDFTLRNRDIDVSFDMLDLTEEVSEFEEIDKERLLESNSEDTGFRD